jgi:hypothetical protein
MGMLPTEATVQIQREYDQLGYKLGWSLLACPWANLEKPDVALITMNPGGSVPEDPRLSNEKGSSYLLESWLGRKPGEATLQRQVQGLYSVAGVNPNEVLAGYLVPFRSPSWAILERRHEALRFGVNLWRDLLEDHRPRLTFTIGEVIFNEARSLFDGGSSMKVPAGWGNASIRVSDYAGGRLIGLPHLSRYQLFGDPRREAIVASLIHGSA